MSEQNFLMEILGKIQDFIKTRGTHNIDMTFIKHEQLIDFESNLKLFIFDAFTRCINIKKTNKDLRQEQTTHSAVYFKILPFENRHRVSKLLISTNKNSEKLLNRAKKIFNLLGMEIITIKNKLIIRKIEHDIDPKSFREAFLSCIDFKYSNLESALAYYFKILGVKDDSNENNNNFESYFKKWGKCFECIDKSKLETNTKFKNAFQDIALFYFYLNVFIQFSSNFLIFDETEVEIIHPENSNLKGMHCEIQLVSKFFHEIDSNNKYISLSSDCCVLCGLTLKTLNLEFFGTKSNLCSSRYWKPPRFINEKYVFQNKFEKDFYNELKNLNDNLQQKKFKSYNTHDEDEIPYSDEWIENQYSIFDKLRSRYSNENKIDIIEIINTKVSTYYDIIQKDDRKNREKKPNDKRNHEDIHSEVDIQNPKRQKQ
jgi:hypothetical protein